MWQSCNKTLVPFLDLLHLLFQMISFNTNLYSTSILGSKSVYVSYYIIMCPDFSELKFGIFSLLNKLWFYALFLSMTFFLDWYCCLVHNSNSPEINSHFPNSSTHCQISLILLFLWVWPLNLPGDKINFNVRPFRNSS